MSLRHKLEGKLKEWQAAINEENVELARSLRSEVETLKGLLEDQKSLDEAKGVIPEPVRAPLPGQGDGAVATDAVKSAEVKTDPEGGLPIGQKAVYQTKFGSEEEIVKGILKDIHGDDYKAKFWAQKKVFRKYLRAGDKELDREDVNLLREVVLNPTMVKMVLEEGIDDIRSLKATMIEAAGTLGGYTVPVDFQMKVIERMKGLTVMRGRATQNTTSRDRVEMPEITGANEQYTSGLRGKWVDETPTAGTAETNFTFGMRGVPIYTYMAETPLSRNNVEDQAFDIEGYLSKKFAEMTAIDEDNTFLTGDGVGKPQGILPNSANALSITEKNSGSASALTWDGLIAMTYGLDAQYRQTGGVWIANKSTYEAIAKLKQGDNYLWSAYQYEGGEGGRPPRLLGYDTLEQEAMPDIAANAYPLIFGNPGGYHIYDRVGMTVERFLDSSTARQNLIYYVMRRRLGGQVIEKWQFVVQKVAS